MKQMLQLENLSCQNCAKHVTKHFLDLEGVSEVTIDLEKQVAQVETSVSHNLSDYQASLAKTIYQVKAVL